MYTYLTPTTDPACLKAGRPRSFRLASNFLADSNATGRRHVLSLVTTAMKERTQNHPGVGQILLAGDASADVRKASTCN